MLSSTGTTERVCLITGSPEAILQVLQFIQEKIREKPDPNGKPAIDFDNKMMAERDKQVRSACILKLCFTQSAGSCLVLWWSV